MSVLAQMDGEDFSGPHMSDGKANRAVFSVKNGRPITGFWNYNFFFDKACGVKGYTLQELDEQGLASMPMLQSDA